MICCGSDRTSRFCPECGKPVGVPPLESLLSHCESTRNGIENRIKKREMWIGAGVCPERIKKKHEQNKKRDLAAIEKWDRWIEALRSIVRP